MILGRGLGVGGPIVTFGLGLGPVVDVEEIQVGGGGLTGVGYTSAVPSTESERRSLQARLERAEALIEEAAGVTSKVATSKIAEHTTAAVDVSREMRDEVFELQAIVDVDADRLALIDMLKDVLSMIDRLNRQIEELDVVFVTFMLVATDQDDLGSG